LRILFDEQKSKFFWINSENWVKVFQWIYKIVCDASLSGLTYSISQPPRCPKCHSHKMSWWKETYPPRFGEEDLPVVTHKHWDSLSLEEKRQAVIQAIEDYYREEYPNYLAEEQKSIERLKKIKNKPYYKEPSSDGKS